MPIRNPFENYDFGDPYAPAQRRRIFFSGSVTPEENLKRSIQQSGFGQATSSATAPMPGRTTDWSSWVAELRDMYTRESEAGKEYKEHLANLPQYTGTSKWGKFGAALVGAAEGLKKGGAAGWEAGQSAAMAPYQRELDLWGVKEGALGKRVIAEDKAMQRRGEYMTHIRNLAKDEDQARQWLADYDLKRDQFEGLTDWRKAQQARWPSQDAATYKNEKGELIEYQPGKVGPTINRGPTFEKSQLDNLMLHQEVMERAATSNAASNAISAGANASRAATAARAETRLENAPILPSQSSEAFHQSLQRAASENPSWSKYYNAVTEEILPPSEDDPAAWQDYGNFLRRRKQIEGEVMTLRNPLPQSNEGVRIIRPPR